ncbi:MAG: hypothetical protein WBO70_06430 [Erysipelotrichaceae bacterium]
MLLKREKELIFLNCKKLESYHHYSISYYDRDYRLLLMVQKKENMELKDISIYDFQGNLIEGDGCLDFKIHHNIYDENENVNWLISCDDSYCNYFAIQGNLKSNYRCEGYVDISSDHFDCGQLLENYGLIVGGTSIEDTLLRIQDVVYCAKREYLLLK